QIFPALIDIADRGEQLRSRGVFQHIPGSAHFETLNEVILVFVHGEKEDLGLRTVLADLSRGLERRESGHADVHWHEVGPTLARFFYRVAGGGGLSDV